MLFEIQNKPIKASADENRLYRRRIICRISSVMSGDHISAIDLENSYDVIQ